MILTESEKQQAIKYLRDHCQLKTLPDKLAIYFRNMEYEVKY